MANRQLSLREKTKSALERITQVEDDLQSLLKGVDAELGKQGKRLQSLEETLEAVTKSIGSDVVQAIIEDARREKQTLQADTAKAEIAKLVEQKVLVPAEEVGEDSFVVGHDVDAEGATVHPGFGHVHFKQVEPRHQEKVKGAKVGSSIPTGPEGTKQAFVIDQIYTFIPPTAPPADTENPTSPANDAIPTEGTVVS